MIESKSPQPEISSIPLWETKVSSVVRTSKLVWAPYYNWQNAKLCARLCDNAEAEKCLDADIQLPILESECVVEIFKLPKTKSCDTKLLKVFKKDIVAYNHSSDDPGSNGTIVDKPAWDEKKMQMMKNVSYCRKLLIKF
jgi:hypothetical protein